MTAIKRGEKYYIEVEVNSKHNETAVWVTHPDHPANEYSGICVYKKYLIPQEKVGRGSKEKGAGMKEYRAKLISTYLSVTCELNTTINSLAQEGWELESVHPLYRSNDAELKKEILLLFSRNRKEQE